MGCYDTILVPCPDCGEIEYAQSKSGDCLLRTYTLEDAPSDVMMDVNRHAPFVCPKCSTVFDVQIETIEPARPPVVKATVRPISNA